MNENNVVDLNVVRAERTERAERQLAQVPPADLGSLKTAGQTIVKYVLITAAVTAGAGFVGGFFLGRSSGKKACKLRKSEKLFED